VRVPPAQVRSARLRFRDIGQIEVVVKFKMDKDREIVGTRGVMPFVHVMLALIESLRPHSLVSQHEHDRDKIKLKRKSKYRHRYLR
jgi:hypothetical protein